jgi:hypothetical protein
MKILQGDELIEAIKKNNKRMISVCEKAYSVFPKKMTYLSEYVLVSHLIKKEFGFKEEEMEEFMPDFKNFYNAWVDKKV